MTNDISADLETELPLDDQTALGRWIEAFGKLLPPLAGLLFLAGWEFAVRELRVSKFLLPPPSVIIMTLFEQRADLLHALVFTAAVTLSAFLLAIVSGVALAILLTQNQVVERTFWPYAVTMQVTPMIAIAPLIIIWVGLDRVWLAMLIMAWMVAFFPMLSNTAIGIKSADHGLRNVFALYGASRWKRLRHLQLPTALPYILAGARISAGLSVIGAVVAEFMAGSGSAKGLAYIIVESGAMFNVARMFAALMLLAAFGLSIWYVTATAQRLLLRHWHESELKQEN
jgi:NitT/TauT family transport system permease protein